jgi:hypothetical protein
MVHKSSSQLPTSAARRHFMRITAAGAGRLSAIAIASSILVGKTKDANAWGIFPRHAPGTGPNCFARGTRVLTSHGEVPVEDLANGDLVITANGALPIKWIARQTFRKNESASWHPSVLPIRVSRFAIDDQTPHRDLYLSQEHALLIDGILIPVRYLVNGRSITVDNNAGKAEAIEYFSVQLDTHQVIFAEGAAAETFRYAGFYQIAWDNLAGYQELYGEHEVLPSFAPVYQYNGGRAEVRALLRLAASRFVDVRDPLQIAYDRIAARAMAMAA